MKINITSELKAKLDILTTDYNCEIGGYLTGYTKSGEIFLDGLLIPPQSVSVGSVKITPQDQIALLKKYGDKCKRIIGHFHSHHGMGAFWSGQDESDMASTMEFKPWFVFIVGSRGNYKIRICLKNPVTYNIENVDFYVKTFMIDLMRKTVEKIFNTQPQPNYVNQIQYEKDDEDESDEEDEFDNKEIVEDEEYDKSSEDDGQVL